MAVGILHHLARNILSRAKKNKIRIEWPERDTPTKITNLGCLKLVGMNLLKNETIKVRKDGKLIIVEEYEITAIGLIYLEHPELPVFGPEWALT